MSRFLRRFSRITSSGRFIPEVDGLRFVAIFSVFLAHTLFYWARETMPSRSMQSLFDSMLGNITLHDYFLGLGKLGVYLFFVISGFILALPFAEFSLAGGRPVALGAFYLRRLTRLEPPFLVCMTLLFLLMNWRSLAGETRTATFSEYLASCTYSHCLTYRTPSAINFVTWSLEVEVQFYFIAPLIARIYRVADPIARRAVLVGLMYGAIVCQDRFRLHEISPLDLTLVCYIQYFLCGFLLADIFVVNWKERPRGSPAWDVLCAAGWVLLYLPFSRSPEFRFATPWLIFLTYACLFKGIIFRSLLSWGWLTTMGGMCYSIYLLHMATISAFGRFTTRLPMPRNVWLAYSMQTALLWVPTVIVSGIFFILIERPCMKRTWPSDLARWARNLIRR